ncbi:MAG: hypothetical protein P8189_23465 [Anaerolineae bacterium]|jgi:nucleoside-diphosphate-sugar epimerase
MSQVLRRTAKVNASGNDDQDFADAQEAGVNPPRWRASLDLVGAIVKAGEAVGHLPLVRPLPLEHFKTLREWRALDTARPRSELGLETRPFIETVRDTLAWLREHGYF